MNLKSWNFISETSFEIILSFDLIYKHIEPSLRIGDGVGVTTPFAFSLGLMHVDGGALPFGIQLISHLKRISFSCISIKITTNEYMDCNNRSRVAVHL